MTTIRLVDAATVTGKTKEIFDAVLLRERRVFGAESVSNIWRCMGHAPALLPVADERHHDAARQEAGENGPAEQTETGHGHADG